MPITLTPELLTLARETRYRDMRDGNSKYQSELDAMRDRRAEIEAQQVAARGDRADFFQVPIFDCL